MVLRLVLLAVVLVAGWLALRWLSKAPPSAVKKTLVLGGLGLLVLTGLVLLLTGKLSGLFALAAGLSPWVARAMRLHAFWRGFQRMTGQAPPNPGPENAAASADGIMTRAQAYDILGLNPGAGEDEIKEAHRRLMRANHPDAGGSTWIATRLNQARDTLLS